MGCIDAPVCGATAVREVRAAGNSDQVDLRESDASVGRDEVMDASGVVVGAGDVGPAGGGLSVVSADVMAGVSSAADASWVSNAPCPVALLLGVVASVSAAGLQVDDAAQYTLDMVPSAASASVAAAAF